MVISCFTLNSNQVKEHVKYRSKYLCLDANVVCMTSIDKKDDLQSRFNARSLVKIRNPTTIEWIKTSLTQSIIQLRKELHHEAFHLV